MVFSKRQVPEGFDPKEFDAYPRIVDMLHFDHNRPENLREKFNDFMAEHYYTNETFEEKFGISMDRFKVDIIDELLYSLANTMTISDKIEEHFSKIVEENKLDPMSLYEKYLSDENALSHVPDTILLYIKLMIIISLKKQESTLFISSLIQETASFEFNYFFDDHGLTPFKQFYDEILSSAPGSTEEMSSLLPYIYSQLITNEYIEKEAVDYYFKRTNYLSENILPVSMQDYERANKTTRKWMKSHKHPDNFLDLKKASDLQDPVKFVSQLMKTIGFIPGSISSVDYDFQEVQAVFAFLEKYSSVYKNDKDIRNLLIVFAYAMYNISECGKDYVEAYLESTFSKYRLSKKLNDDIEKLNREIAPLKTQLEQKQKALNSIQLDYDRLKNKELAKLKEELEKQKQLQKELQEKINSLEEINSSLEANIEEMEAAAAPSPSTGNKPNSYVENKLKSYNILIMGGHQIWQNRLKEIYPYFTYIDSDNVNFDINITRNADFIFFNTLHCSHTLYYRIKNNVNNGRTNNKEKIVLVSSNNLDYFKEVMTKVILKT